MSQVETNSADSPQDDAEVESSSAFLRPRRPQDDEIDMTPMIDCVFLLLIFFIVNFRADQDKAVALPAAKYGNPVLGLDSVFLTVAAGEGETTHIYLGDQVDPATLLRATNALDQEQEILDYMQKELQGPKPKKQVIIKGEGKLRAKQLNDVYKSVSKALDGQSLHVAVTAEGK